MPDHLARVHPFLLSALLRVGRSDDIEYSRNDDDNEEKDDSEGIADVFEDVDDE